MRYFCCDDERRRNELAQRTDLNGIEFLEVLDTPDQAPEDRQRTLFVHFIRDPGGLGLVRENVVIEGGERIRDIRVLSAQVVLDLRSGAGPVLVVEVDPPGDFSTYTLRLVPTAASAMPGLDPLLRAVDFSFKVNCETLFDPLQPRQCAVEPRTEPALDYLARDYPSLRQLLLDRLAVLLPDWQERNPADAGMALVELLAYVGDQLGYRQDAVATESYLGTCRLRTSARRHARLVDYFMHDGCNARAWVQVQLDRDTPPFELQEATFYSAVPDLPPRILPDSREHERAKTSDATAFRLLEPARLAPEHNTIHCYTWGARQCCLPKGAVRATLRGDLRNLTPGMVLVFKEVLSPRTGDPDDADLSHRHAVRLTEVSYSSDPIGGRFVPNPATGTVTSTGTRVTGTGTRFSTELRVGEALFAAGQERRIAAIDSDTALETTAPFEPSLPDAIPFTHEILAVTEVAWHPEDALPLPLCLSAETAPEYGAGFVDDVTIALGNIVLADHGAEIEESLDVVPADTIQQVLVSPPEDAEDRCRPERLKLAPARFRPPLKHGPLTQAVPYTPPASARAALSYQAGDALPQISLFDGTSQPWKARLDLLSSRAADKHFVVEVEADGLSRVRFGDGKHGERPGAGREFSARYRVGNGRAGNLGADTLVHLVSSAAGIASVSNPLPAVGGTDLESIEEVRRHAPFAFRPQTLPGQPGRPDGRTLRRAVTPADYAAVTETHAEVQRAAATFRWTGSWRTVSVTVDRLGGGPVTTEFENELRGHLEPYRLAGHDLEIEPPRPVALEVVMHVRIEPGYFVSQVRRALLEVFSNRTLPDGRRGVFHPDNLTFGQTLYLSPLYGAAQAVDGVESVDITTFQRRDRPGRTALDEGRLVLGRLEIARLDNDPSFPERGTLALTWEGGR